MLQMGKTVVKASFVRVYNPYIPHDSQLCMGKYKAQYVNILPEQESVYKVKSDMALV